MPASLPCRVDQHRGPGSPAGHLGGDQHFADGLLLIGHAALLQRTHVVFHLAELVAQVAGRMKAGEIVAAEAAHLADHQRQGVAHGQHGRRAGAGRQAQRARFFQRAEFDGRPAAARPKVLAARPVIATIGTPSSASEGNRRTISSVSPLCERISMTSSRWTRPKSPWTASAGCRQWLGVPVEASVAMIFWPTNPALPMPETITLPRH